MKTQQYTIRNIPESLDRALRKKAKRTGQSFNTIAIAAMQRGSSSWDKPEEKVDILDEIFGANTLDEGFYEAIEAQSQIDPEIWK